MQLDHSEYGSDFFMGVETGEGDRCFIRAAARQKQRDIYVVYSCVSQNAGLNDFNDLFVLRRNFAVVSQIMISIT